MSEFLWHEISESEKDIIRRQAKKIMDDFSEKLSEVDLDSKEPVLEREHCERVEGDGLDCDSVFRKIMFENAPHKNDDFILGETKKW